MATSNIRSRWVMANGVKTHYSESGGNGPVLVALHGGGAGSSGVAGMGAAMERLADEFRVIAPDSIGGFGLTDPYAPTPYGLISRVEHLRDLCDALCLDKFTILGNSQGAFAAAHYAMLYTPRIEKMILISSLTIAQALGLSQAPNAAMKALGGYDGTREAMKRLLEALIVDRSRITEALIDDRQAAATRPGALESFKNLGNAIQAARTDPIMAQRIDMRQSLPLLTKQLRTIFLWGDSDPFAIPATGKGVEALLPDVKFHWVAGAGHQVQTDQPDASVKIIRDFLRS
ncbi:MAG: alpha/beta hydrolase [Betaproteobacteria bacterium]|nr:alpha/beta hydrolase [Betaproteobacteria bacterium]